jgi:hypothetical protein
MSSGLASRRGGQSLKPLNELALKSPSQDTKENTVPTPRTSRGHLLANLRTAPKTAAASSFAAADNEHNARNMSYYAGPEPNMSNGPKTSLPNSNYGAQAQVQGSANWTAYGQQQQQQQPQHFTPEQILAPPEIHIDEQGLDPSMDPDLYARLMQQNVQLAQQRFMLQQQLHNLTQAQQQLDAMNLNGNNQAYANANVYQQQLLQQQQQQVILAQQAAAQQPQVYTYIDPATGQQAFYVDQSGLLAAQLFQEQEQHFQMSHSSSPAPRFEVSPPRDSTPVFRRSSPARRHESPLVDDPTPLPPPSANAFRRGHKKSSSLMLKEINNLSAGGDALKSTGPRTANFPVTPMTGGCGPGQARAGEHPTRQPRGPPAMEELKAKPTSLIDGSKNFAASVRRSAVKNLTCRAERRMNTDSGSNGSISPISETAEEAQSPLYDNESDSGRSGSGSLNGEEVEPYAPSSRTSTGSWGAIGSDRPSSAQKARKSADSVSSGSGDEAASNGSFASAAKRTDRTSGRFSPQTSGRKAPMMVLSNAEKRKNGNVLLV